MNKARGYQSLTPANNMILKRKWDQTRFDMHRTKVGTDAETFKFIQDDGGLAYIWVMIVQQFPRQQVRDAKPMIDNKPPETYMHLHLKLKKVQMEEERRATVQRDNRILLENLAHILSSKGRMDNRNG